MLKKDAERFVLEQQRRASLGALYQAPPETLGEFVPRRSHASATSYRTSTPSVRSRLTRSAWPRSRTMSPRSPRQAELALRVLKRVLANAKERGLVDEGSFG